MCFAFPGGGYCRRYFTFDMPGSSGGGEAGFHTERGWIFAAVDHLGFGDSTVPAPDTLDFETVAAANVATVRQVMADLDLPGATALGIGQSMGGCFTIVAQGQHGVFDGVGILGFSAIRTAIPTRPGSPPFAMPWIGRATGAVLKAAPMPALPPGDNPLTWGFHWDDEPPDVVAADMGPADPLPPWRSATVPACALRMVAPYAVAQEAAAITVPVLLATGERDVVPDPREEPRAYMSAADISVYVCPQMAHMHNFARTRTRFWQRIHAWGTRVAVSRRS